MQLNFLLYDKLAKNKHEEGEGNKRERARVRAGVVPPPRLPPASY